ncbi:MAG: hypothetical protein LBR18_01105, partial [Tannerella sp.]|nr:hypothetical protein [Tannerella sp.]
MQTSVYMRPQLGIGHILRLGVNCSLNCILHLDAIEIFLFIVHRFHISSEHGGFIPCFTRSSVP